MWLWWLIPRSTPRDSQATAPTHRLWCPCCPALLPQQGAQLVCLSARFCPSGGLAGAFIGWSAYSLKKKKKEILWGKSCLWVSAAFGDLLSEMHLITSAMAASHLASVPHETQSSFYGGCRHAQGLAASPSKPMGLGLHEAVRYNLSWELVLVTVLITSVGNYTGLTVGVVGCSALPSLPLLPG